MPVFNLIGKFGLDSTGFNRGLDGAERKAKGSGKRIGDSLASGLKGQIAGAFGAAAIGRAFNQAVDNAGRLRDESARLGLDPETFQAFEFAAKQSGATVEDVARAMRQLAVNQRNALDGEKKMIEAFGRLGISMDDLEEKDPAKFFFQVADAIEKSETNTNLISDAVRVLGESGLNILPALKAGFDDVAKSAFELGVITDNINVQKLAALGDTRTTLFGRLGKRTAELFTPFADFLHAFGDSMESTVGAVGAGLGALSVHGPGDATDRAVIDKFNEVWRARRQREQGIEERSRITSNLRSTAGPVAEAIAAYQNQQTSELREIKTEVRKLNQTVEDAAR